MNGTNMVLWLGTCPARPSLGYATGVENSESASAGYEHHYHRVSHLEETSEALFYGRGKLSLVGMQAESSRQSKNHVG